jgi:TetR/AcrR family transcriptional repressor of nem operon
LSTADPKRAYAVGLAARQTARYDTAMPRDGSATRLRILDSAHRLVVRQGYAASSLDEILAESGVTKGGFFHHFDSKEQLAMALFERYIEGEKQAFEDTVVRAERLSNDPLQQVLITIALFEEMFAPLTEPHPGCLIGAYTYQNDLMTPTVVRESRESFLAYRDSLSAKLRAAESMHEPTQAIDHEAVADMLNVIIEGGFIMGRVLDDAQLLVRYLRVLRSYLEVVFGVAATTVEPVAAS